MKFKLSLVSGFVLVILFVLSCANGEKKQLNPNGDSELALLMREMEANALDMKKFIETGRVPASDYDHSTLFTAIPTEEGKTDLPEYKTMAQSYLDAMKSLQSANQNTAAGAYKDMVDMCLSCHKSMCPGPVVRIEKLYVGE
ncbi:MAG: hypothetical protein HKN68_12655 [Saprospiraceae bacterium]|nr:hypothetical protein [Saprospiraceae bacterium]